MKQVFCLYDKKSRLFMQPFFEVSAGVACRALSDEMQRSSENNVLARHPEDFELWCLGEYDEESGMISSQSVKLCEMSTLVTPKQ